MAIPFHELARDLLPNLTPENYRITSPMTWEYNCIAWALGLVDSWWWPSPGRYWPPDVPREETVDAFIAMFATQRYAPCAAIDVEADFEKVALFVVGSTPTHAARQLPGGWWTSKLGPSVDIEHIDLEAIGGGAYGEPAVFLSRKVSA